VLVSVSVGEANYINYAVYQQPRQRNCHLKSVLIVKWLVEVHILIEIAN